MAKLTSHVRLPEVDAITATPVAAPGNGVRVYSAKGTTTATLTLTLDELASVNVQIMWSSIDPTYTPSWSVNGADMPLLNPVGNVLSRQRAITNEFRWTAGTYTITATAQITCGFDGTDEIQIVAVVGEATSTFTIGANDDGSQGAILLDDNGTYMANRLPASFAFTGTEWMGGGFDGEYHWVVVQDLRPTPDTLALTKVSREFQTIVASYPHNRTVNLSSTDHLFSIGGHRAAAIVTDTSVSSDPNRLIVWNLDSGVVLNTFPVTITLESNPSVCMSAAGNTLWVTYKLGGVQSSIGTYNLTTGAFTHLFTVDDLNAVHPGLIDFIDNVQGVVRCPDGDLIVVSGSHYGARVSATGGAFRWVTHHGYLEGANGSYYGCALTTDGLSVWMGGIMEPFPTGDIDQFDLATGTLLQIITLYPDTVFGLWGYTP